ncbi:MAG: HlyD family efflux transporter periplasmic adaptor subunit [Planctomycetota bacterium]|nr:HlyD family efflux transporter periplasmic adaptor subunit [Planctomycetota bacterium]
MAPESTDSAQIPTSQGTLSAADLIDRLARFDGPPEGFLSALLAVQCRVVAASQGAILRTDEGGRTGVLSAWPALEPGSAAPVWLASAAEIAPEVANSGKTAVRPLHSQEQLYGEAARKHIVLISLRGGMGGRGVGAYVIDSAHPRVLREVADRLELTAGLIGLYEMRVTLQRRDVDFRRLRAAMEILTAVNEANRFTGAAMALCNEMAARWECERVSLGLLKGRYVHLKAMSHTEKFSRKMDLVQDIEAAAEECFDQDVELIHPAPSESMNVTRATAILASRRGPHTVLSLPLRREGEPVGVLVVERVANRPFRLEEAEAIRLTTDLATARICSLHETDRWFGARLASSVKKGLAAVVGPKHTWAKLAVAAALAGILVVTFVQGDFRADATFVVQATDRRVICPPFDGDLAKVYVKPDDEVTGRTVNGKWEGAPLAAMDTAPLVYRRAKALAEREKFISEANVAGSGANPDAGKRDQALASAQGAQAEIDLLDYQIAKAVIRNPFEGNRPIRVLSGEAQKREGTPVTRKDMLFEIAPLDKIHAELLVPEDEMGNVERGQHGEIANPADPKQRIRFTIVRISPAAEMVEQKNIFRVYVDLDEVPTWARPGREGVAKIELGRKPLGYIWTRQMVNWVRMKLWI